MTYVRRYQQNYLIKKNKKKKKATAIFSSFHQPNERSKGSYWTHGHNGLYGPIGKRPILVVKAQRMRPIVVKPSNERPILIVLRESTVEVYPNLLSAVKAFDEIPNGMCTRTIR